MKKHDLFRFIISLILCQGAGIIGSFFTISAIQDWYFFLNKPSFSPPSWIFGPVWTILYTLMAISFFIIWRKGLDRREIKFAYYLFIIHLFFNAIWSILFFGLENPFLALIDIVIMLGLILILTVKFYRIQKIAGILLVPYLFWVSFASILNYYIWILN